MATQRRLRVDTCDLHQAPNNDDVLATKRHISCLFPEILTIIFRFLNVRDKGRAARVCASWRDAAYNRRVWMGVEARLHLRRANPGLFPSLVRRGIKRIQILSLRRSLRDVIGGVSGLQSLNLMGCYNVTDVSMGHALSQDLPALNTLNLSLCKAITDSTIARIAGHLKNLEVLELGGCSQVTSNGLLLLACGLKRLKKLNLRSCRQISDVGVEHLCGQSSVSVGGASALEELVLQDCQKLTDTSLRHISQGLHKLKAINLSFCASVTDSGLKFLSKLSCLRELNLSSCDNISDIGIGYLADGGSRLCILDVSFCERITDQALVHMSQGLFHLTQLSLCACAITDYGLGRLVSTSKEITLLNIGQCHRITDHGLSLISSKLQHLVTIDLYGCTNITRQGLEKIAKLPHLSTLNQCLSSSTWCGEKNLGNVWN